MSMTKLCVGWCIGAALFLGAFLLVVTSPCKALLHSGGEQSQLLTCIMHACVYKKIAVESLPFYMSGPMLLGLLL